MSATYISVIEELAKADNILHIWKCITKGHDRKAIAESLCKYIQTNWMLLSSHENGNLVYYYRPKSVTLLNRGNLKQLYKFLFIPKNIIKVYNWE